jgi:cytochrome c-type biogenesis protein CcmE
MTDLTRRRLFGLGALLVAGSALGWLAYGNLGENLVYYWSPTELVAHGAAAQDVTVRIGGLVVPGTFDLEKCNPHCHFRITDGRTELRVASTGLPPQMFREGIGVVVEGRLQGEVFATDRILVKHNNEYRAPGEGQMPDFAKTLDGDDAS